MTTWEEFRKGHIHHIDYGYIGKKVLELNEPEEFWGWLETQDYSDFEKGIAIGLTMAWIEIFTKGK